MLDLFAKFDEMIPPMARALAARLPPAFEAEDLEQVGRIACSRPAARSMRSVADVAGYLRQRIRGAMLDAARPELPRGDA